MLCWILFKILLNLLTLLGVFSQFLLILFFAVAKIIICVSPTAIPIGIGRLMYMINILHNCIFLLEGRLPSFRLPDKNKVSNLWVSLIPVMLNLTFAYLYNKYINPSYYYRTTATQQSLSALWLYLDHQ